MDRTGNKVRHPKIHEPRSAEDARSLVEARGAMAAREAA